MIFIDITLIGSIAADLILFKKAVRIASVVIVGTKHFSSIRLAETARTADTHQFARSIDTLIYQGDKTCLINVVTIQHFLKSAVAGIEICSHKNHLRDRNTIHFIYSIIPYIKQNCKRSQLISSEKS